MKFHTTTILLALPLGLGIYLGAQLLGSSPTPQEQRTGGKQTSLLMERSQGLRKEATITQVCPEPKPLELALNARLAESGVGDTILLPFPGGQVGSGTVSAVHLDPEDGWRRISGKLSDGSGSFVLGSNGVDFGGLIRLPRVNKAMLWEQNSGAEESVSSGTEITLQELPLDKFECVGFPTPPGMREIAVEDPPTEGSPEDLAPSTMIVPRIDTLPSARAVIFLDFDGARVKDPFWNEGQFIRALPARIGGKTATSEQIIAICQQVAEDFTPVKITVTTDPGRYAAAKVGQRVRCIVTPYKKWMPYGGEGVGGVASLYSFSRRYASVQSRDMPCWCFDQHETSVMALTISHEVGHTFGLIHDGTWHISYYGGHGGWGPIMGAPFGQGLTQWSKGEYDYADNEQDDLAMITRTAGVGSRSDDYGNTRKTSTKLPFTGKIAKNGLLTYGTDSDWFQIKAKPGAATFSCKSQLKSGSNVDVTLQLVEAGGKILAESTDTHAGTITHTLNKSGTYYVVVRPGAAGDPGVNGYSNYGSLGAYTLEGTYPVK